MFLMVYLLFFFSFSGCCFVGVVSSMTQRILICILLSGDVRVAVSWELPVS